MIPVFCARSGAIPVLEGGVDLRFVTTPVASQLTGLSTEKLREWTSRRALVPADVRPKGKGSPAKFSWQTVLILRIAALLRDQFKLELQAHKASFARLRRELHRKSFISLWGQRLSLSAEGWTLTEDSSPLPQDDILLVRLDPHLEILRDGFALADTLSGRSQLELFSLPNLHGAKHGAGTGEMAQARQRRSA
jgi:hypothetical protein